MRAAIKSGGPTVSLWADVHAANKCVQTAKLEEGGKGPHDKLLSKKSLEMCWHALVLLQVQRRQELIKFHGAQLHI